MRKKLSQKNLIYARDCESIRELPAMSNAHFLTNCVALWLLAAGSTSLAAPSGDTVGTPLKSSCRRDGEAYVDK
jgi:hypothetical protein